MSSEIGKPTSVITRGQSAVEPFTPPPLNFPLEGPRLPAEVELKAATDLLARTTDPGKREELLGVIQQLGSEVQAPQQRGVLEGLKEIRGLPGAGFEGGPIARRAVQFPTQPGTPAQPPLLGGDPTRPLSPEIVENIRQSGATISPEAARSR